MVTVLRLSPDLAIVPSMVQSVEVMPYTGGYGTSPEWYYVRVVYLFGHEQTVASFRPRPASTWDTATRNWLPVPDWDWDAELAACEARAHVVYESIVQAVKECEQ